MIFRKFPSIVFYVSTILALLSVGLVLTYLWPVLFLSSITFDLFSLIYIVLPIALAGVFVYAIQRFSQHRKVHDGKSVTRIHTILYASVILLAWMITGLVSWATWDIVNDKPPQFFPFDDPKAIYTIEYTNNWYWIHYKSTSDMNTYSYCEWDDQGNKRCGKKTDRDFTAFIASSPIDLKSYINKHVQVHGEFIYVQKQCIVDHCKDYGGGIAGLRIDEIKAK